ncbi:UNVERIFIED_CONTAM: hypothetical protein K2H54_026891 [Gekko kuhli]
MQFHTFIIRMVVAMANGYGIILQPGVPQAACVKRLLCAKATTSRVRETAEKALDSEHFPPGCVCVAEPMESHVEAIELGRLDFSQPLANRRRGYDWGRGLNYGPCGA